MPDSCYQAIINWMKKRHGWNIQKEWIVDAGRGIGFHWAVKAYTHPGDNVIVQTPVYYPFFKAVKFNGCHIVENQLQCTNGRYEIDFLTIWNANSIPHQKSCYCAARTIRSGGFELGEELTRLANPVQEEHHVVLCSDEIHSISFFEAAVIRRPP